MNPDIDNFLQQHVSIQQVDTTGDLAKVYWRIAAKEVKAQLTQLLVQERIDELSKYPPTDYEGRDYLGGFNDARRQLADRIKELKAQLNKGDR